MSKQRSTDSINFIRNKTTNHMKNNTITKLHQLKKLKTLLSINDDKIFET